MQFTVFQYNLPLEGELADLNSFLSSNRVVSVTREIANCATGPLLVFVVETAGGAKKTSASDRATAIDYKEVLPADEFAVFSALRERRKQFAEEEKIPLFAVFNNAQLAEMVTSRMTTIEEIAAIAGVGKSRVEKYAAAMCEIVKSYFNADSDKSSG